MMKHRDTEAQRYSVETLHATSLQPQPRRAVPVMDALKGQHHQHRATPCEVCGVDDIKALKGRDQHAAAGLRPYRAWRMGTIRFHRALPCANDTWPSATGGRVNAVETSNLGVSTPQQQPPPVVLIMDALKGQHHQHRATPCEVCGVDDIKALKGRHPNAAAGFRPYRAWPVGVTRIHRATPCANDARALPLCSGGNPDMNRCSSVKSVQSVCSRRVLAPTIRLPKVPLWRMQGDVDIK